MVLVFVFESFSLLVAPVRGCCSVKKSDGLGRSLGSLGTVLGSLWAVFGRSWGGLGTVLGRSWGSLGWSWCSLVDLGAVSGENVVLPCVLKRELALTIKNCVLHWKMCKQAQRTSATWHGKHPGAFYIAF